MSISASTDIRQQIADANTSLEAARASYSNATGVWVDVAAYEVKAAEMRLNALLREARGEFTTGGDGE